MFPNINPKQLEKAMRQMGVKQEEIDATEVVIKTHNKELVIRNP
ncbi:nascent polypeptide-associated complex protein, partial [Candidatus Woesearchaeota archaeon]|nr:nascent polypeptide-associated complex protein [Candidatus Woesearchaeota archaeon]